MHSDVRKRNDNYIIQTLKYDTRNFDRILIELMTNRSNVDRQITRHSYLYKSTNVHKRREFILTAMPLSMKHFYFIPTSNSVNILSKYITIPLMILISRAPRDSNAVKTHKLSRDKTHVIYRDSTGT